MNKLKLLKALGETDFQSYVPVANTLVEEDSPWDIDNESLSSVGKMLPV